MSEDKSTEHLPNATIKEDAFGFRAVCSDCEKTIAKAETKRGIYWQSGKVIEHAKVCKKNSI